MSDINASLGAAGAPITFVCDGQAYKLSVLKQKIKGAFAVWLKQRALHQVDLVKELEGEKAALELKTAIYRDFARGLYDFGSEISADALHTPEGLVHFLWLLLQPHHAKITEDDVAALLVKDPEPIKRAIEELNQQLEAASPKPTPPVDHP